MSFLFYILLGTALWWIGKAVWRIIGVYLHVKNIYNTANPYGQNRNPRAQKRNRRNPKRGGQREVRERIIPPEYATDVEYVEVKTFSQEDSNGCDIQHNVYREEQVSDAEWEEIK